MNPGILALAAVGGFIGYEVITSKTAASGQPKKEGKIPFLSDFWNSGSQPQTGNGQEKSDFQEVNDTIQGLSKFATSLFDYFGQGSNGAGQTGNGLGTQTDSFDSGGEW